jgi:hypothetical protein
VPLAGLIYFTVVAIVAVAMIVFQRTDYSTYKGFFLI